MKFLPAVLISFTIICVVHSISFSKKGKVISTIMIKAQQGTQIEKIFLNGNEMFIGAEALQKNLINLQYYLFPGDILAVQSKKTGPVGGLIGEIDYSYQDEKGVNTKAFFQTGSSWVCNQKAPKEIKGNNGEITIWSDDDAQEAMCSFKIPCDPNILAKFPPKNKNFNNNRDQPTLGAEANKYQYQCHEIKNGDKYKKQFIAVRSNENKQLLCLAEISSNVVSNKCHIYDFNDEECKIHAKIGKSNFAEIPCNDECNELRAQPEKKSDLPSLSNKFQ